VVRFPCDTDIAEAAVAARELREAIFIGDLWPAAAAAVQHRWRAIFNVDASLSPT